MTPTETVHAFLAAWNAADFAQVVALLADDVRYHNIPMDPITGREAVKAYLFGHRTFTEIDWQLRAIAADGDTVLTERVDNFRVDGIPVSLPIMGAFVVRDGLICEWRDYFDLAMYRRQLGG